MKKLAFLGGAAGLGLIALLGSPITHAADHIDSNSLLTNPMADINDVYAWMTSDGTKVNLALTVSPFDTGDREFGPSVQYVFHVSSRAGFGMAGVESRIICTFESNTNGQCWVVDPQGATLDHVSGDLSGATGKASVGGKLQVFAGRRSDPFFFNLGGFKAAVTYAVTACNGSCPGGPITANAAGCLQIDKATGDILRNLISGPSQAMQNQTNPCPMGTNDCFAPYNVMAIVVQVDKALLLNGTDSVVSVWASTHAGQ